MDPQEELWSFRFQQLADYKRAHGDCNVLHKSGPCFELGCWVSKQRVEQHKNELSVQREAKLSALGFVWTGKCYLADSSWNERFRQLLE
jgi:hypothetical protein